MWVCEKLTVLIISVCVVFLGLHLYNSHEDLSFLADLEDECWGDPDNDDISVKSFNVTVSKTVRLQTI